MLRVLLTNDDGIHADGLQTLRRALVELQDIELAVIAPDANMSATARSITTRRPLWVTEVAFDDGTVGYSCDGTPVDCVRLAHLGLAGEFDFETAAAFPAQIVDRLDDLPLPDGTLLNVNVPAGGADGVEVTRLGKRIYRDALEQVDSDEEGRKRFRIYGDAPVFEDEQGTDLAAVAACRVAVTPLHFDLTAEQGLEELRAYDLARLLAPAAEEVTE